MPQSAQRIALDLQRTLQELQAERGRTQKLLAELDRQNAELDRLRHSVHRESNSRLLAEEALDETRDRLHLAVEAARLALWDWQLPTDQVFMTGRWGEMLGDIAMDGYWRTKDLFDRTHPEDRARVDDIHHQLLEGRLHHAVITYRVRTADGWLWVESHGMVAEHDAAGRPLRLMGTLADIDERKRIEAESERARELAEQASRAKSEFLANISHEVRTPLNALMGLTRLLMESPLNAEQRSWLDLMDSSAHALLSLLNDVLDLSRIEAGKLSIEDVGFDLRQLLQDVAALYGEQARAKPLEWAFRVAPDLPTQMQGDPGRLRQVMGNLLSNALKFTPKNGRIRLEADLLQAPDATHALLRIQVQDSGIGISPKQQATIFDAFTQADASTARRYGGSGLGLAICSRLVKLMGGRIELLSALGQGSTFTVTVPLGQVQAPPETERPATPDHSAEVARFRGLCVLIAEDHPVNELLMNKMLQRWGCQTRVARDGQQAVDEWSRGGVDLVLMDVQMPGTNGLQATRMIREQEILRGWRHTPVVAVTANAMNGDREACLAAGMDGYAAKPVTPQALMQAMDEALARARGHTTAQATAPSATEAATRPAPGAAGALDVDKLLRRLDGDKDTLQQLAQVMRSDLQVRLRELQTAMQTQDIERAVAHAHGLKGSLGSMTAERGARLAKGLELAALARDWSLFGRALPLMQVEAQQIDAALAALLTPGA